MDSKLPIDILENVMQLATEGCKAIANYIREVRTCLVYAFIGVKTWFTFISWFNAQFLYWLTDFT
jgi:hypothetical protein